MYILKFNYSFIIILKYIHYRYLFWIMKVSIFTYLVIFGLLPIIFHYSYAFQKKILFLNFGKLNLFI